MNKYRVGDSVLLFTWKEMVDKFGMDELGDIFLSKYARWNINREKVLPNNRIISITNIIHYENINSDILTYKSLVPLFCDQRITPNMIKGYANEYYLQEIKEELCLIEKQ